MTIDLDHLPFAAGTLADLEAERAAREDQLEHIRVAYPDSRAIRVLANYLAEIDQEIAATRGRGTGVTHARGSRRD